MKKFSFMEKITALKMWNAQNRWTWLANLTSTKWNLEQAYTRCRLPIKVSESCLYNTTGFNNPRMGMCVNRLVWVAVSKSIWFSFKER